MKVLKELLSLTEALRTTPAEEKKFKQLVMSFESDLEHEEARYKEVDFDFATQNIYWITQESDPYESKEAAKTIARELKREGYPGWTVNVQVRDEINNDDYKKVKWYKASSGKIRVSEGEEEVCEHCGQAHAVGKDVEGGYEPHPEELKYHPDSDDSYWAPSGSPSVSEAKNPEFLSTVIDREIENLLKSKKMPMDRKDEVARVYKRGFRDGFSGGSSDSTGVKPGDLPIFNDGQEMGKKARKQAEKDGVEIPKMRLSNRLGERKANPAFDKLVNSYFTPPSKVAESKDQENQDVAAYIDQYEEDGGADLEEDELDKSIEMFLKKKGYTSFDFPKMKKRIMKALGTANDWG